MNDFVNVVDPVSGMSLLQMVQSFAVSLIGFGMAYLMFRVRNLLPDFMQKRIDDSVLMGIHSAALTKVREMIQQGKDPKEAASEIVDYMKRSMKDAFESLVKDRGAATAEKIFREIAISKIPVAELEINTAIEIAKGLKPEQLADLLKKARQLHP